MLSVCFIISPDPNLGPWNRNLLTAFAEVEKLNACERLLPHQALHEWPLHAHAPDGLILTLQETGEI